MKREMISELDSCNQTKLWVANRHEDKQRAPAVLCAPLKAAEKGKRANRCKDYMISMGK